MYLHQLHRFIRSKLNYVFKNSPTVNLNHRYELLNALFRYKVVGDNNLEFLKFSFAIYWRITCQK